MLFAEDVDEILHTKDTLAIGGPASYLASQKEFGRRDPYGTYWHLPSSVEDNLVCLRTPAGTAAMVLAFTSQAEAEQFRKQLIEDTDF